MKSLFAGLFLSLIIFQNAAAQDSLAVNTIKDTTAIPSKLTVDDASHQFTYKKLIIPAALISYGVASLSIKGLKQLNSSTQYEISEHQPDKIKLDNYAQFAPAVLVYGLNAAGVQGKHNFRDRSIIYGTSMLITSAITVPLKHIVKEERPDESNKLSFPSGHTAIAFASAQFMFREYKDTNFLLGISGYSFAVFTGIYRMLNNKHWFGDVVGGAGFGILSTELAYWLYPKINTLLGGKKDKSQTMVMPFYQQGNMGIGLVKNF
ncbi:phosphatase PAP2 family protein [Chryseobacterium polytrichastri]|uniref:PAP2 superfamily protein n=1 Tax=Chryseobacterium polytrichastri TaxID=1302687 RepID=A0A1M6PXR9_9FLAO|nr:phosphatase PAP2 family protein [Chryseobacterium polytrichastri]SHK12691.1 PAP2 superfamily protein [Chryseobacterium polytrichastri]